MEQLKSNEIENQLESFVDKIGLATVLDLLSSVCYGKQEHLESNWQDYDSAKEWEKSAKKISKLASQVNL